MFDRTNFAWKNFPGFFQTVRKNSANFLNAKFVRTKFLEREIPPRWVIMLPGGSETCFIVLPVLRLRVREPLCLGSSQHMHMYMYIYTYAHVYVILQKSTHKQGFLLPAPLNETLAPEGGRSCKGHTGLDAQICGVSHAKIGVCPKNRRCCISASMAFHKGAIHGLFLFQCVIGTQHKHVYLLGFTYLSLENLTPYFDPPLV